MITVIDTETTGDGPADQVIEMAAVVVGKQQRALAPEWYTTAARAVLVCPTVPIQPEARAVHHISDEEIEDASLTPASECPLRGSSIIAAHLLEFDYRMLRQTWPGFAAQFSICTWRCARHIWPGLPSYSLQALRYRLELECDPPGHPHRAAYDAEVCAALLLRMLEEHTLERLVRLTFTPVTLTTFPYGEHRGRPFSAVPLGYLRFIQETANGRDPDLLHTTRLHLEDPDRAPVLLEECRFGRHRGQPWASIPPDYLRWLLTQDFDRDTHATARHYLALASTQQGRG